SIRGIHPQRPQLDLLVDAETWLVLREERRNFDGKPWLTSEFETVEYREPDAGAPSPAETLSYPRTQATEPMPLTVTFVPAGFVRMGGFRDREGRHHEYWSD